MFVCTLSIYEAHTFCILVAQWNLMLTVRMCMHAIIETSADTGHSANLHFRHGAVIAKSVHCFYQLRVAYERQYVARLQSYNGP